MKNSLKSMILGLVLAVAAMGFAVAMPLAVQSFTRLTSEHDRNRVAQTDPSPEPLVTPDTAEPDEIVLPEPLNKPDQRPEVDEDPAATRPDKRRPPTGDAVGTAADPKETTKENRRGQGKGKALGQDKGPKPESPGGGSKEPKEPKEPKDPKEPKEPEAAEEPDAPQTEGSGASPGNPGNPGGGKPDKTEAPEPAPVQQDGNTEPADKGKGKGKAVGFSSARGSSAAESAPGPAKGNKKH